MPKFVVDLTDYAPHDLQLHEVEWLANNMNDNIIRLNSTNIARKIFNNKFLTTKEKSTIKALARELAFYHAMQAFVKKKFSSFIMPDWNIANFIADYIYDNYATIGLISETAARGVFRRIPGRTLQEAAIEHPISDRSFTQSFETYRTDIREI